MRALGKAAIVLGIVSGMLGVVWTQLPPGATRRDAGFHAFEKYPEPSAEVVASGQCVVPICTDVDLGDRYFRFYSEGVARKPLEFIPKGSCSCQQVKVIQATNSDILVNFYQSGDANAQVRGMGVSPLKCAQSVSVARPVSETTYEKFQRRRLSYELQNDFEWHADKFSQFEVYKEKEPYALGLRRYVFVPKSGEVAIDSEKYPVAFETTYGLFDSPKNEREVKSNSELNISASIRASQCLKLWWLGNFKEKSSDMWVKNFSKGADVLITTRIFRK